MRIALDEVVTQYFPLEYLPRTPERALSPSTWREMLFSGEVYYGSGTSVLPS